MAAAGDDIAHVYLVDCGLDLGHEELQFMTYDDATLQLLVVKGNHVFAYDALSGGMLKWMYPLQVRTGRLRGWVGVRSIAPCHYRRALENITTRPYSSWHLRYQRCWLMLSLPCLRRLLQTHST
jgi:hypothetical protein